VSQRTKIRETIIRAIEQDEHSSSRGDFYARGSIRAIAGAVGTDPVPLIGEYEAAHRAAEAEDPPAATGPPAGQIPSARPTVSQRRLNWRAMLMLVLLAVLGVLVCQLIFASHAPASRPDTQPGRSTPVVALPVSRRAVERLDVRCVVPGHHVPAHLG